MIGYLVPIGFILIFLGVGIVLVGSLLNQGQSDKSTTNKSKIHIGVGGFIGPIPFGFANSRLALYMTMGAVAFFFIVWLILRSVL